MSEIKKREAYGRSTFAKKPSLSLKHPDYGRSSKCIAVKEISVVLGIVKII